MKLILFARTFVQFLQYLGYIILITTLTMQKRSSNVCLGLLLVARNSLKGSAHPCFFLWVMVKERLLLPIHQPFVGLHGDLPKPTRTYTISRYTDSRSLFLSRLPPSGSRVQTCKSVIDEFFWKFHFDKFNSNQFFQTRFFQCVFPTIFFFDFFQRVFLSTSFF